MNVDKFANFPTPYLLVENLSHSFDNQKVLKDIDFRIYAGQFTGLLGESGSGKSTLARIISGQLTPQQGQVFLNGREISRLSRRERKRANLGIQMVFQDPYSSLNPQHIIARQIEEPLIIKGMRDRQQRQKLVKQMMEDVGLDPSLGERLPEDLSGGQQQRVAIACALITEPKLLIADEPVSALDLSVQAQILNLFRRLRQKRSFACLFISHDLDVIHYLCDRVLILDDGVIQVEDKVERVFADRAKIKYYFTN